MGRNSSNSSKGTKITSETFTGSVITTTSTRGDSHSSSNGVIRRTDTYTKNEKR